MPESTTPPGPFALDRFLEAQRGVYETACRELRNGRKLSHWMWFVFPQMKGLGSSAMAQHFGIASLAEARAYLAHPVLGSRLTNVTGLMLAHRDRALQDILGSPDDMKFRSAMTLFSRAAGPDSIFARALEALCAAGPDAATLALLADEE